MSVWIGEKEYKGASVVKLNLDSEVQKHGTEKGFSVADHVKHDVPGFEVTLTLGGSLGGTDRQTEYYRLRELRDKSTLFTFICDFGSYNNMIIKNLGSAIERSNNTYSCSLIITQVRVAELKTEFFTVNDKDGKELYSPVKPAGIPPTQSLQDKTVDLPPKNSNQSTANWLLSLVGLRLIQ